MVLVNRRVPNPQLDPPPSLGQRQATFRFELFDGTDGTRLGDIKPSRDQPPTITHDTSRTIKRSVTPFVLPPGQLSVPLNPVRHRVRIFMIIADVEYPLGTFMFTNTVEIVSTAGTWVSSTLLDEMFLVDQKISVAFAPRTFSLTTETTLEGIEQCLQRLLEPLPITFSVASTPYVSATSWAIGTNRGQIINELALTGDYMPPWFDHNNVLRIERNFDPGDAIPDFDWDSYDVVIEDSISRTNDLLEAPNRIIVVSNASENNIESEIVGIYDIASSAPHSIFNRGFVIPEVYDLAINDQGQASAVARSIAQRQLIFESVELSTIPDPRHDSNDVIRWDGENWLELSWSLQLTEGSDMRHVMRKVYT